MLELHSSRRSIWRKCYHWACGRWNRYNGKLRQQKRVRITNSRLLSFRVMWNLIHCIQKRIWQNSKTLDYGTFQTWRAPITSLWISGTRLQWAWSSDSLCRWIYWRKPYCKMAMGDRHRRDEWGATEAILAVRYRKWQSTCQRPQYSSFSCWQTWASWRQTTHR